MLAYQRSSCTLKSAPSLTATWLGCHDDFHLTQRTSPTVRFMGLTPNEPEQAKDMKELSARAAAGKPIYGESDLDEYLQGVAMRNSLWSQLKFGAMPWWVFGSFGFDILVRTSG